MSYPAKNCECCGSQFIPRTRVQRFCTDEDCRAVRDREKQRARNAKNPELWKAMQKYYNANQRRKLTPEEKKENNIKRRPYMRKYFGNRFHLKMGVRNIMIQMARQRLTFNADYKITMEAK